MADTTKNAVGFWNAAKVVYSDATKALIKNLMKEANVSNTYRQHIQSQVKKGESLESSLKSEKLGRRNQARDISARKTQKFARPGLRPKHVIEANREEIPAYRSQPVPKLAQTPEKNRLAHLMAYGEEPKSKHLDQIKVNTGRFAYLRRKLEGTRKLGNETDDEIDLAADEDRFTEIIREVKERRQFLDQMRVMGKEQLYKNKVETEISQLVREMEEIDMRRSKELQRAAEARAHLVRNR